MATSQTLKELFLDPTTIDKLNLFQQLFDASELDVDLALALLKIIHKDLSLERSRDRSAYKRYASTIEALRYHKADMLRQVVSAWKKNNNAAPAEWFPADPSVPSG